MATKIEWATETWNPVIGCKRISRGCDNCYAVRSAQWLSSKIFKKHYRHILTTQKDDWNGKKYFCKLQLDKPLKQSKPTVYFVCSMSDIAYNTYEYFPAILDVMRSCPQHRFLLLTKRPKELHALVGDALADETLSHIGVGVSVEYFWSAWRIDVLQEIKAAMRFISFGPMIGNIGRLPTIHEADFPLDGIHWVIVEGESGFKARPMHPQWARNIRDRCHEAGIPFFFKSWGDWYPVWEMRDDPDCRNVPDSDIRGRRVVNISGGHGFHDDWENHTCAIMERRKVNKHRRLDGQEWNERPDWFGELK